MNSRSSEIGIGIGTFTATTSTINHFKPQPMAIHFVFIVVIAYCLGKVMEKTIPSRGRIGKILNPGPVRFFPEIIQAIHSSIPCV